MKRLLVTFDAFGTLFAPRLPVVQQYSLVARDHGVEVHASDLKDAFKQGRDCIACRRGAAFPAAPTAACDVKTASAPLRAVILSC